MSGQAYVSMVPGTHPDGRRVDIRNLRSGAIATAPMVGGGFDPIAVSAEAGDSLAITVVRHGGDDTTGYSEVPIKSRPRVVRSSPGSGKTDVPLNSVIVVVFNQPMAPASLNGAFVLRQDDIEVPGALVAEGTDGAVLAVRFVPESPLDPGSTYQLTVSTAAQATDGSALDATLTVEFTTTASASTGAKLRVVHAAPGVGNMDVLIDGLEVVTDLPYGTASGYLDLSPGLHDVWYQVALGTMDGTHQTFAGGQAYTVLPCCVLFPLGGFLFTDNTSPPASGNAKIRVIDYASGPNSVRVYLTAPDADLAAETPRATVDVLDATGYFEVPAGEYRIRLTSFDSDDVVVDSGTLILGAGQVRTAVAADAAGGGAPRAFFILDDLH